MSKIHVLYTGCEMSPEDLKYYYNIGFEINSRGKLNNKEIIAEITEMDAYIPGGGEIVSKEIIDHAPRLKIIVFCGVDYNYYIPVQILKERGIALTNAPGINSDSVAEYTVSFILSSIKKQFGSNQDVKLGNWNKYKIKTAAECTIGVIGMGNIGSKVAKIMHSLGANVIYYSKTRKLEIERECIAQYKELNKILESSDVITIHVPYNQETNNLIDWKSFQILKKGSIIINTSRAEIINPDALIMAIKSNIVSTVMMDGFYFQESSSEGNAKPYDKWGFLELDDFRFVITPHIAYNTSSTFAAIEKKAMSSIVQYFSGDKVEDRII